MLLNVDASSHVCNSVRSVHSTPAAPRRVCRPCCAASRQHAREPGTRRRRRRRQGRELIGGYQSPPRVPPQQRQVSAGTVAEPDRWCRAAHRSVVPVSSRSARSGTAVCSRRGSIGTPSNGNSALPPAVATGRRLAQDDPPGSSVGDGLSDSDNPISRRRVAADTSSRS